MNATEAQTAVSFCLDLGGRLLRGDLLWGGSLLRDKPGLVFALSVLTHGWPGSSRILISRFEGNDSARGEGS